MKVIPPSIVTDAVLISSTIVEADYPEWNPSTVYAAGARCIRAATHRIYESAVAGNVGANPASGSSTAWTNIGPTNRWAMFDQAVGTASERAGSIAVTLSPIGTVNSIAVLDTTAASVRVQVLLGAASLYDHTQAMAPGLTTMAFSDLPPTAGAQILVTISGASASDIVSIGTLIVGTQADLGTTADTPQIGITDYSRNETDDFGVTTVVQRSWAKSMSVKTQIDSSRVDAIQRQFAAVRAVPCLWIGEDGFDSLAVYGIFKEFSVDLSLGANSYCTITIQGLTTAGILDNPTADFQGDLDAIAQAQADELMRAALYRNDTDTIIKNTDGTTIRTEIDKLGIDTATVKAFVENLVAVGSDGSVKAVRTLSSGGYVSGNYDLNNGTIAKEYVIADEWGVIDPANANDPNAEVSSPFRFANGQLYLEDAKVKHLDVDVVDAGSIQAKAIESEHYSDKSIDTVHISDNAVTKAYFSANGSTFTGGSSYAAAITTTIVMDAAGSLLLTGVLQVVFSSSTYSFRLIVNNGATDIVLQSGSANTDHYIAMCGAINVPAGTYTCRIDVMGSGISINPGGGGLTTLRTYA